MHVRDAVANHWTLETMHSYLPEELVPICFSVFISVVGDVGISAM